ncbi:MAG TPA: inorganic diphosphatase [Patescibacteria group bacterium]|nr:inorganic diphosphatase [Patescibacteria group bacterium]
MKKTITSTLVALLLSSQLAWAADGLTDHPAAGFKYKDKDPYTLVSDKNWFTTLPAFDKDGNVNVLITIPAGTSIIWELSPLTGNISRLVREGKPQSVQYMGYPGNYGVIARVLTENKEPLEALVLGDPMPRGTAVKAKIIGALRLAGSPDGEVIRIIAVHESSPLYSATSIADLISNYPGATSILETWFVNRNGKEKSRSLGYLDVEKTQEWLSQFSQATK